MLPYTDKHTHQWMKALDTAELEVRVEEISGTPEQHPRLVEFVRRDAGLELRKAKIQAEGVRGNGITLWRSIYSATYESQGSMIPGNGVHYAIEVEGETPPFKHPYQYLEFTTIYSHLRKKIISR
jgi:hypothetical protein